MVELAPEVIRISATFLGGCSLRVNGKLITDLSTIKSKALLSFLVQEGNQPKSRSYLASLFWPDVPENTALHNLRQAIVLIKKSIENTHQTSDWLKTTRDEICIQSNVLIDSDAQQFCIGMKNLLGYGESSPVRGFPIQTLKRLLSLYKGEFLESLSLPDSDLFDDWLSLNRESIHQLAIRGNTWLLHYHEQRKEWNQALQIAENLTILAPWDEEVHERLIHSLIMLAQKSAAVTHYHYAVNYFRNDLKVEPGMYLEKALQQINNLDVFNDTQKTSNLQMEKLPRYAAPFIGRSKELETLEAWIADHHSHILTIIGPGGSGKTRLAAKLAELQVSLFRDGVYFVSIANCWNEQQISLSILSALDGIPEIRGNAIELLAKWATNRKALLVLDNVEDCDQTALFAANLIEKAHNLLLVFTSYTSLHLQCEKVFTLGGLGLIASNESNSLSEAVQLFLSQKQLEQPVDLLTGEYIDIINQICALVEGMPLAVGLAAGQTRYMPVAKILAEMKQSMDVLRLQAFDLPERHRSIQASFENAWKHLSDSRQRALSLLTGFLSPFTEEAANRVYGVSSSELRDLVEQSLLLWDGNVRYSIHRMIRHYAKEKLILDKEESQKFLERHANWFLEQIQLIYSHKELEHFSDFLRAVQCVVDDLVQALEWLIGNNEWQKVNCLLEIIFRYYEGRGLFNEGSDVFIKMAGLCEPFDDGIESRVKFSSRAAEFQIRIKRFEKANELCEFALNTAKKNQWFNEIAYCMNVLSTKALALNGLSGAEQFASQALAIAMEQSNLEEQCNALYNIGDAHFTKGEIAQASDELHRCERLCLELKLWPRLSKTYNIFANIACIYGDLDTALESYSKSLKIVKGLGNLYSQAVVTNNIGTVYMELADHSSALQYLETSLELCREILDHEGESVALANIGEISLKEGRFQESMDYALQSLKISLEIESTWGEMSARIILAEACRKNGYSKDARDQVLILLNMAVECESISFYYRALVEACQQLIDHGYKQGLAKILLDLLKEEGMDDFIRTAAHGVIAQLPSIQPDEPTLCQTEILSLVREQLLKI